MSVLWLCRDCVVTVFVFVTCLPRVFVLVCLVCICVA